ncbi:hypothetical protein J8273_3301 [Carpediemonas membranifera]|uniref:Golgin subfamily A member 7/ERF4 domain-containing protein n=1 Tax=Carpediemonas membranifera TaxID=201153 RepID=A0A8J6E3H2_9EUKA|nr:hypothetical protein J8273_3301 [Carpediemonas membranifera]|eukprot:KAG9393172.1 hypothetical protein J8273_3301 [Carpediemonas membranifera]
MLLILPLDGGKRQFSMEFSQSIQHLIDESEFITAMTTINNQWRRHMLSEATGLLLSFFCCPFCCAGLLLVSYLMERQETSVLDALTVLNEQYADRGLTFTYMHHSDHVPMPHIILTSNGLE